MAPSRPKLSKDELEINRLIESKGNMGISQPEIRNAIAMDVPTLTKVLQSLLKKQYIKIVKSVRNRQVKIYMDFNCDPAPEISGGHWFSDGKFDVELVNAIRNVSLRVFRRSMVVTIDHLLSVINKQNIINEGVSRAQIEDTIQSLKMDDLVEELRSSGVGEFSEVPAGRLCYRLRADKREPVRGTMASIPCGVCPRINECTPDGIISPNTCVYYQKWLGLDF